MKITRGFAIRWAITCIVIGVSGPLLQSLGMTFWFAAACAAFIGAVVAIAMTMFNVGEAKR